MSDRTDIDSAGSAEQGRSSNQAEATKQPLGEALSRLTHWPLLAAVAIALIAGVVAGMVVTGWLRPSSGASGHFTDQQAADAKQHVCAAAALARQAVAKNMHLKNPDPENPVAQLAVAANARLSLSGSAAYLRGQLEEEPAAPPQVAKAARAMAGALERLSVGYLADQPNSAREQVGHDVDSDIAELGKLCG